MAEFTSFNIVNIYLAIENAIKFTKSLKCNEGFSEERKRGIIQGLGQFKNIVYNETLIEDPRDDHRNATKEV